MLDVEGFILVGGVSRRMGTDKAAMVIDGRTSLQRIVAALSAVVGSVSLVGARRTYEGVSVRNVPDVHASWGALGGIHAALSATQNDWALIVACDLPLVTPDLLERLKTFTSTDRDVIVPIQADGRAQPLCALYRRAQCLPEIEKLIGAGEHTPRALLANVRTRRVEFDELKDLPGAEHFLLNLNTVADLEVARKVLWKRT